MKTESFPYHQLLSKAENYCAYQDRCHKEVVQKLYELRATSEEIDQIIATLIQNNYLNEERFAQSFVRGKHYIKKYGKVRIINELKAREISKRIIEKALKEIDPERYEQNFMEIAQKTQQQIGEITTLKNKKKFVDTLLRKGYETDLIYNFINSQSKDKKY